MAIDPNIAIGAAPQNPAQFIGNMVGLKGQVLQQNQLQQQMGANQATSAAMQQSYDPATGRIDTNKLTAILSQDPRAAYNLPTIQNQILEQQQKQIGVDTGQFDLALKKTNYLQGQLGSLMSKPDLSQQDFINLAAEGVKNGLFPADQAVRQLQSLPQDPSGLKQYAQQMFMQQADNAARLQMMMPQNSAVNTGGGTQFVSTNPMSGQVTLQGGLQNTLTPGEASTPTPYYNQATGQQMTVPRSQYNEMTNPQGSTMGLLGTGTNGRYPQAQGAPGAVPAQGAPGLAAGPSLGATAAAESLGKSNADQITKLQVNADSSPQRVMFLQNMAHDLQDFTAGPGADWTAKANALALQISPEIAKAVGVDPQAVASKEAFTKYATNLALNTAQGMGGAADSISSAIAGNPHAGLSTLGNQQIIQVLTGLERATQAKNLAWQTAGVPPQDYGKWATQWNKDIDPRVFAVPEMPQADVSKMYNGLKPADQKRFKSSLRTAIDAGIVQLPGDQ